MRAVIAIAFLIPAAMSQTQVIINAPYVTTPAKVVQAMLKLAAVKSTDTVYDLGCGDGRIVIEAAKQYGAHGVCIDIDPKRIAEARAKAAKSGVASLLKFEVNDIFDADIHPATVVTLYLLPDINLRLRSKLLKDLKPGARVVSHAFRMGDWKPDKQQIVDGGDIYVWTIPPR